MEKSLFDRIARGLGSQTDRRSALKAFAATIAAIGLGRELPAEAAPEVQARCLGLNANCAGGRSNCCQGLKCKTKTGTCEWLRDHGTQEGDWCERKRDCDRHLGLKCDKQKNECIEQCLDPMVRCAQGDNCCGASACNYPNSGNRLVCCGVYGQVCAASSECCVGYTCRSGYCR
ncbi:MAG: hypothetical protein ACKOCK_04975 [Chloroflexota bacterium]